MGGKHMKKIKINAVIIAFVTLCSTCLDVGAAIETQFNSVEAEFSVSGTAEKSREAVLTEIQPFTDYNDAYVFLTPEELASGNTNAIMRTKLSGQNGEVDLKIKLTDISNGRYVYKVNTYGFDKTGLLIVLDDTVFTSSVSTEINSGDVGHIKQTLVGLTAIDDGNGAQSKYDYISQCIKNMKTTDGYTQDSFVDAYMISEGLYNVSKGIMSFDDMLSFYSLAIDAECSKEFSEMDDKTKTAVETLFKSNIPQKAFSREFSDNIFAAKCYRADSTETLKTLITNYAKQNGISLDKYNALSDIGKENVFIYMYNNQKMLISASGVMENFTAAVNRKQNTGAIDGPTESYNNGGNHGGGFSAPADPTYDPRPNNGLFADVLGHWAENEIKSMIEKGIINGYDDGSFRPDGNIKRSEFVKIICEAYGLNSTSDSEFSDVPSNAWYRAYVSSATAAGVIEGDGEKFRPEDNISRQDVAVIIKRYLDKLGVEMDCSEVQYKDYNDVSDYAQSAICALTNMGLMNGSDGNINPKDAITRAEATVIMSRCLSLLK